MAMDGLPEGVPPSGRVPGQLLQAAPILKWPRRRYREVFAKVIKQQDSSLQKDILYIEHKFLA